MTPIVKTPLDLRLNLQVTGKLPMEDVIVELLKHDSEVRKSMSPENLAKWDNIWITAIEDAQKVWRGLWKSWGVLT